MEENAIKISKLTKKYRSNTAVDNVSLEVKKGMIYGLIGRNGAGKTTIMRLLLGLSKPNDGSVEMLGKSGKDIDFSREKCGFIIEEPCFYEKLTAYDNLMIRAKMLGLENQQEAIMDALKKVGLHNKAKDKVKTYSMGMKQILGVANAILGKPEILVLDEPVNGLDPIAIVTVRDLLLDLNKQGTTILISSHILGEIQKLCTYYGFILDGKLVKEISQAEVEKNNVDLEKMFIDVAKGGSNE